MYKKIAAKPTPLTLYREQLERAGALSADEATRRPREFRELMEDAQSYARDFMPRQPVFAFGGRWKGLGWAGDDWSAHTAVAPEVLHEIAAAFNRVPAGFTPHPRVARLMEALATMVREGRAIDWSCGEALAVGSSFSSTSRCAWPDRTPRVARSASGTRCCTTSRPTSATSRSTTSAATRSSSASSTACCPRTPSSGSSSG
jgi:2-oxoglutarate dehydrogenase complex dehydrogenase (E1) component-like enzyme